MWINVETGDVYYQHTLTNVGSGFFNLKITDGQEILEINYIIGKENLTISEIESSPATELMGGYVIPRIEGGQKPYHFQWTGTSIDSHNENNEQVFDLEAGEYCFTVTDYDNCQVNDCVEITGNCNAINDLIAIPTCPGDSTGGIHVIVPSGQAQHIKHFEFTGNGIHIIQASSILTNILPVGEYQVIATNLQDDCSEIGYVDVEESHVEVYRGYRENFILLIIFQTD